MASKYLLLLDPAPQRTFYVSPSFTGNPSPTFTTIQAAINAAPSDGTRTLILIYPGVYAENIIMKRGIYLRGVGARETVILQPASTLTPAIDMTYSIDGITHESGVENISIVNITSGMSGIRIDLTQLNTSQFTIRLRDVWVYTDGKALSVTGHNSIPTWDVRIQGCYFRSVSTDTCSLKDTPGDVATPPFAITESTFFGALLTLAGIRLESSGLVASMGIRVRRCEFTGSLGIAFVQSTSFVQAQFHHCYFDNRAMTVDITAAVNAPVVKFWNCTLRAVSRAIEVLNTGADGVTVHCYNCTSIQSSTGAIFYVQGGQPRFYGFGCRCESGRLLTALVSNGGVTKYVFIDCVVRNAIGGEALNASVAGTPIMLGNFTTDGLINANFTQDPASFNVQTSKPIV